MKRAKEHLFARKNSHIAQIIRHFVTLNYASEEKRFEDARKNI